MLYMSKPKAIFKKFGVSKDLFIYFFGGEGYLFSQ